MRILRGPTGAHFFDGRKNVVYIQHGGQKNDARRQHPDCPSRAGPRDRKAEMTP
jgi:hypothetical protein